MKPSKQHVLFLCAPYLCALGTPEKINIGISIQILTKVVFSNTIASFVVKGSCLRKDKNNASTFGCFSSVFWLLNVFYSRLS